jgi:hypothetical protein
VLNELEAKLVSVIGDALASRAGVSVVEAAGPLAAPPAGSGLVRAGVSAVASDAGFVTGELASLDGGPEVRRVLPLRFTATIEFARTAADATPAAQSASRRLLLEDVSLVGYALAAPDVRDGSAFRTAAPDPGFEVHGFDLDGGTAPLEPLDEAPQAALTYEGRGFVWPPGTPGDTGLVVAVDPAVVPLPLAIASDSAVVVTGGSTSVRIRGVSGDRLASDGSGARVPQLLAVGVASDLPPADRGTISSGDPAADAGFRLVPAASPETVVEYHAPAGALGAVRSEQVVVHLAVTGGRRGAQLGSLAVSLRQGP